MSAGRPRAATAGRRAGKRAQLSEAQWQAQIEGLAGFYGWRVYHTHDSRRSAPGFPDLVMVRGPELIFAELKGESTRVTREQEEWLQALHNIAHAVRRARVVVERVAGIVDGCYRFMGEETELPAVDVYLWRAPDLDPVHDRLARGRRRTEPVGAL